MHNGKTEFLRILPCEKPQGRIIIHSVLRCSAAVLSQSVSPFFEQSQPTRKLCSCSKRLVVTNAPVILYVSCYKITCAYRLYVDPLNTDNFCSFFTQTSKFFVCFSDYIDKKTVQHKIDLREFQTLIKLFTL